MPANPFSAARFAPGVIPWLASGEAGELGALLDRAIAPGARHQILGGNGSGKSTLLRHLEVEATRRSHPLVRFRGSAPPPVLTLVRHLRSGVPLLGLVDEFAELGSWGRPFLRLARKSIAVVVTTHEDLGLPTLARCEATPSVARHVIESLTGRPSEASATELEVRIARHAGNLREVLFELYDEVERLPGEARADFRVSS